MACASEATTPAVEELTGTKPDLTFTTISAGTANPQTVAAGDQITVNDTVQNQGSGGSVATQNRYWLATGTTKVGSSLGSRSVAALGTSGSDPGSALLTLKSKVPDGDYSLLGCVDDPSLNNESDETNNCIAAQGAGGGTLVVQLRSPDLIVSAVATPSSPLVVGDPFTITSTTANQGGGPAGGTTTHFYWSSDGVARTRSIGTQGIGPLAGNDPGTSINTSATVVANTPSGAYYLLACADQPSVVLESDDNNNCLASTSTVQITGPDLVESGVSVSPATVTDGATISITESAQNIGDAAAGTTKVKVYASTDAVHDPSDLFMLPDCGASGTTGTLRTAPAMAGGDPASTATTNNVQLCYKDSNGAVQSIPNGTYYVIACGDGGSTVLETDESNNCSVSSSAFTITTTTSSRADLVETAASSNVTTPLTATAGTSFTVTDTVQNVNSTTAGASLTGYYLSTDGLAKTKLLGSRSVPSLAGGATSSNPTSLSIPSGVADGSYSVLTCADYSGAVMESNETNNCRLTVDTNGAQLIVQIASPDLIVSALTDPAPGAAYVLGQSFTVTSTTANQGGAAAPASTTRYYLSTDGTAKTKQIAVDSGVPALAANDPGSSRGTSASAPAGTNPGDYYLLACADQPSAIAESNETNNCRASTTKINITGADLIESAVSVSPASFSSGSSATVNETATNIGNATAGSSRVRIYVSTDTVRDGSDPIVVDCASGNSDLRTVGTLTPNVPAAGNTVYGFCYRLNGVVTPIPAGAYYLFACGDARNTVVETNENNNCAVSSSTFTITP